jgi:hypothetical protein
MLGVPYGIAVSADGEIFVANGQAVVGINSWDGTQRTVASGGVLAVPIGIAFAPDGDLYVADASGSIVQMDLRHQRQAVVAAGQYLAAPVGIAVKDHKTVYVSDATTRRIVQIDPRTGNQMIVSTDGALASPFGLALVGDDHLLVGDPDAFDLMSGIISVDLGNGAQYPLVMGSGNLANFRCLAVVVGKAIRLSQIQPRCLRPAQQVTSERWPPSPAVSLKSVISLSSLSASCRAQEKPFAIEVPGNGGNRRFWRVGRKKEEVEGKSQSGKGARCRRPAAAPCKPPSTRKNSTPEAVGPEGTATLPPQNKSASSPFPQVFRIVPGFRRLTPAVTFRPGWLLLAASTRRPKKSLRFNASFNRSPRTRRNVSCL